MDKPVTLKISKIIKENESINTFYFTYPLGSQPGQFVMLWIPGVDQKPFSISFDDGETFGLTIYKRGPLTEKLFEKKEGDKVGISGPYGTGFSILPHRHYIMVAGGYGAAPLRNLSLRLAQKNTTVDFCIGARARNIILFEKELSEIPNVNLHLATADGSGGIQGSVINLLKTEPLLSILKDKNTMICTCGPEKMEKAVLDIANQYDLDCEVSVERHIKCGMGICGQCCIDDLGIPTCKYGPVVNRTIANQIVEFGNYTRGKSGAKCHQ